MGPLFRECLLEADFYSLILDLLERKFYEHQIQKIYNPAENQGHYWSRILPEHAGPAESPWRQHMQWLYRDLIKHMVADAGIDRLLKTDLYNKAVSLQELLIYWLTQKF